MPSGGHKWASQIAEDVIGRIFRPGAHFLRRIKVER